MAVSVSLSCCIDPAAICDSVEHLWVKVKTPCRSVSIGVVYMTQDRKHDLSLIRRHISSIDAVRSRLDDDDLALLFGDYNQSSVFWKISDEGCVEIDASRSTLSEASAALLDSICYHGLLQMNTITNHISRTLIFGNEQAQLNCSIFEADDTLNST